MTNFYNQSQFVMGRDVNRDALMHQLFALLTAGSILVLRRGR